jgi:hypothetical protein
MPFIDPELRATIIRECENHENANWRERNYRRCITIGTEYFVKFDTHDRMKPELATQMHIQSYAASLPDSAAAPRIAKVLFHFQEGYFTYNVMEYIELGGPANPAQKADALTWLTNVPPAPGQVMGPVGGGPIRHAMFKDYWAPMEFDDLGALERYLERGRLYLPRQSHNSVPSVNIRNERVRFWQSDMDDSNFGVDKNGEVVLMDFASIGLLPETFILWTLCRDRDVAPLLVPTLGLSGTANQSSLNAFRGCLWKVSSPQLGLGSDGMPINRPAEA